MNPLNGKSILEIDQCITFTITDRFFGGEGKPRKYISELTEIEVLVMDNIANSLLLNLKEAWADLINLNPGRCQIETDTRVPGIVSPADTVILIEFGIEIGDVKGIINLCIPYETLEPIFPNSLMSFANPT